MDTFLSICLILNAQKFWTLDRIGNSRTRTLYLIWINFVGKWLRWGLLQNRIPVLIVLMGLWDSNKQNKMINFKSSRNKTVPLIWLLVWQFFPCMFCLFWAIFIFLYKNLSLLLLSLSDSLGRPAYTFLLMTWFFSWCQVQILDGGCIGHLRVRSTTIHKLTDLTAAVNTPTIVFLGMRDVHTGFI